ncbi:hypothetical protein PR003_g4602 [Phytophthora rubi]|uniref:Uncharacterized protein n=1 Tax=Phytophthora rubi TaxID=129364 RepID=A0A6A3NJ94_9STRA|nr:hypothetical protein PR002_g4621 [Phytophthora rubi]KAE9046793.1 hypothetical protein PR001_g4415 [Phytophthora rubi]KAE9352023.1 hypothetical protein PR003_g4602 [Phytophthora rubi]
MRVAFAWTTAAGAEVVAPASPPTSASASTGAITLASASPAFACTGVISWSSSSCFVSSWRPASPTNNGIRHTLSRPSCSPAPASPPSGESDPIVDEPLVDFQRPREPRRLRLTVSRNETVTCVALTCLLAVVLLITTVRSSGWLPLDS